MIAAAHKSSGKTVVSTGLAASLHSSGLSVQTFKKGPDYIDPMWLSAASGNSCYNLDFNGMSEVEIITLFAQKRDYAKISLVEGNKGLYDGVKLDGSDSNAQLAKLLNIPVILVIDANGMTRGIAPLLAGYQAFDYEVNIAGVILNKVGGSRHEEKLVAAINAYTDIEVIGSIWRNKLLDIGERHLGLTTPSESEGLRNKIADFDKIIANSVDLSRLIEIASTAQEPKIPLPKLALNNPKDITIGIAKDNAFGFYYEDDLEVFAQHGVKLVEFDCLNDNSLPKNLDGIFIGGGFPETQMQQLAANKSLLHEIKSIIEAGLPTYAECGGLMYLCKSIEWKDQKYDMVGIIDANALMNNRPQGRGYVKFKDQKNHPWGRQNGQINAHEFHYASLENRAPTTKYGRKISRGHGIDGQNDAIIIHNLVAGFCHLRNSKDNPWVKQFVDFVKSKKS